MKWMKAFVLIGILGSGALLSPAFSQSSPAPESEPARPLDSILKCQGTCHKPENLARAKHDRFNAAECASCHAGEKHPRPRSPFQSVDSLPPSPALGIGPQKARVLPVSQPAPASPNRDASESSRTPPAAASQKYPDMAFVPAGEFIMGSNERWDDEAPEHIAHTDAFYIDLYEVTNEEYKQFVDATGREPPYHWPNGAIPPGKEKHPVIYVNWFDARDYCRWEGKRLPTEKEWEKAARGPDGLIYPWGNIWDLDKSNNPYKGSTGTEPIGSYPEGRSPYGLYDMSGNVWEWVNAYYLPHPGNTVPKPEYGKDKRVLKGGSWFDCLSYGCGLSAPTFNRSFFTPEVRNNSFGFRCAKSP